MVKPELIPLVNILTDKKPTTKEAHLILFEYCNLSCSFCHQDHGSKLGFDSASVLAKVDTLIANAVATDHYVINITGGELFLDDVPDQLIESYATAARRLLTHFKDPIIVFGTNLIYQNIDRVIKLIEDLRKDGNVILATSYDPSGRFNSGDREVFFTNLEKVKHLVETVNVVITKQNIESFLAGGEGSEFDYLCANYTVYFDHYIPSKLYKQIQPDEDLISRLYLHLNDRYPESHPIKGWKESEWNDTTCRSTKIVNKEGVVTTCWSEAGKDSILDEAEGLKAKDDAETRFIERYNCFACEYYRRCGMRCFLHHNFIDDGKAECQIKKMYDVILT